MFGKRKRIFGRKFLTWLLSDYRQTEEMRVLIVAAALTMLTAFMPEAAGAQEGHASYAGACVPIASVGGSGNGPEFVVGPVEVVGPDVYGLDRDYDGVGCE